MRARRQLMALENASKREYHNCGTFDFTMLLEEVIAVTKCIPIKELKNTAAFAQLVEESPDPVIVTKNGYEKFAVMTVEKLDSLRLEAARAHLYDRIDAAEQDFAQGRFTDADASQRAARDAYGL